MGCGTSKDRTVDVGLRVDRQAFEKTHKLLLLGAGESGKSTIMKFILITSLSSLLSPCFSFSYFAILSSMLL